MKGTIDPIPKWTVGWQPGKTKDMLKSPDKFVSGIFGYILTYLRHYFTISSSLCSSLSRLLVMSREGGKQNKKAYLAAL
jgi:hypothetical protein